MAERLDPVDLTNCDREPIHLLGAIQPVGALLALSRDWIVERASANLGEVLGIAADQAIGASLTELIDPEAVHGLRNRLATLFGADGVERIFGCSLRQGSPAFDVALHLSCERIVLEMQAAKGIPADATNTVRSMMGRLDQAEGFARFFSEGARLVRALTGYDRVMVYRFSEDGAGEVVAESVRAGIGSFKGLHYPASDIPKQARVLYKRNLLRVIADVHQAPVPILPVADHARAPLDLSLSMLRSVSPIHIEYLKNMGVGASMSISIVVDDQLWGLFACHHYAPHLPSFEPRSTFELFA